MKKKICYYVANDLLLQKYKYMYDYAQSVLDVRFARLLALCAASERANLTSNSN